MSECDFEPLPAAPEPATAEAPRHIGRTQPLETIRHHHVRVEPAPKGTWRAWTMEPGNQYPTQRTATSPQAAVLALLRRPPTWTPWPHPCTRTACDDPNTVVMDSPPGDDHLHWYCPEHAPRPPK